MNQYQLDPRLLGRKVNVLVVGAGGTGSHVVYGLQKLHSAMIALGHPHGLNVVVMDDDTVSPANVGRQLFFPSEVGSPKASAIINRVNQGFGVQWGAVHGRLIGNTDIRGFVPDITIGCVDNRKGRKAILDYVGRYGGLWLDIGNRKTDGQVVLGEVVRKGDKTQSNLPNAADLFPEIVDDSLDGTDDTPSCSLAEALEKQALFINQAMATAALNLLFKLFRYGSISSHGVFINLETDRSTPLLVDPAGWERMGYKPSKPKRRSKKAA